MPQMSPLWWTFMMMIFIMLFVIMLSILYFNFDNKINKQISLNKNNIFWKW